MEETQIVLDSKDESQPNNKLMKKIIIHGIKNSTTFSKDTLTTINNLSYDDRLEILSVYNERISCLFSLYKNKYVNV